MADTTEWFKAFSLGILTCVRCFCDVAGFQPVAQAESNSLNSFHWEITQLHFVKAA